MRNVRRLSRFVRELKSCPPFADIFPSKGTNLSIGSGKCCQHRIKSSRTCFRPNLSHTPSATEGRCQTALHHPQARRGRAASAALPYQPVRSPIQHLRFGHCSHISAMIRPKVISAKDLPPKALVPDFKMYDAVLAADKPISPPVDSEMDKFLPMLNDYLKREYWTCYA